MIIDRELLKASDISILSKMNRLKIIAFATKLCEKNGYDSEIYCGIKERSFKGFESNKALKINKKKDSVNSLFFDFLLKFNFFLKIYLSVLIFKFGMFKSAIHQRSNNKFELL